MMAPNSQWVCIVPSWSLGFEAYWRQVIDPTPSGIEAYWRQVIDPTPSGKLRTLQLVIINFRN